MARAPFYTKCVSKCDKKLNSGAVKFAQFLPLQLARVCEMRHCLHPHIVIPVIQLQLARVCEMRLIDAENAGGQIELQLARVCEMRLCAAIIKPVQHMLQLARVCEMRRQR